MHAAWLSALRGRSLAVVRAQGGPWEREVGVSYDTSILVVVLHVVGRLAGMDGAAHAGRSAAGDAERAIALGAQVPAAGGVCLYQSGHGKGRCGRAAGGAGAEYDEVGPEASAAGSGNRAAKDRYP